MVSHLVKQLTPHKKGQIFAIASLLFCAALYWVAPSRLAYFKYLAIIAGILCASSLLIPLFVPSVNSTLARKLIFAVSASAACFAIGVIFLMKGADTAGVSMIVVGFVLRWFVVRPYASQVRNAGRSNSK